MRGSDGNRERKAQGLLIVPSSSLQAQMKSKLERPEYRSEPARQKTGKQSVFHVIFFLLVDFNDQVLHGGGVSAGCGSPVVVFRPTLVQSSICDESAVEDTSVKISGTR